MPCAENSTHHNEGDQVIAYLKHPGLETIGEQLVGQARRCHEAKSEEEARHGTGGKCGSAIHLAHGIDYQRHEYRLNKRAKYDQPQVVPMLSELWLGSSLSDLPTAFHQMGKNVLGPNQTPPMIILATTQARTANQLIELKSMISSKIIFDRHTPVFSALYQKICSNLDLTCYIIQHIDLG